MINSKSKYAPIVLFVYNRPWHTQKTIEALQKNELSNDSNLIIYSDDAKNKDAIENVKKVREYINRINGFNKITIINRKKNWGLANSIIDGVTSVINEFGSIIVLEDDLVTSPYFLKFMNDSLSIYENEDQVASIHGYVYPIPNLPKTFFIRGADCWGWATWKNRWKIFEPDGQKLLDNLKSRKLEVEADFNRSYDFTSMLEDQILNKNDSWAIRWYMSTFLKNMLTLYPKISFVQNIGLDNSGVHCNAISQEASELVEEYSFDKIDVIESMEARYKFEKYHFETKPSILYHIKSKLTPPPHLKKIEALKYVIVVIFELSKKLLKKFNNYMRREN